MSIKIIAATCCIILLIHLWAGFLAAFSIEQEAYRAQGKCNTEMVNQGLTWDAIRKVCGSR